MSRSRFCPPFRSCCLRSCTITITSLSRMTETCALLKQALSVDGFVVTVADSRTALMRFLNDFAVDLITATSV